MINERDADREPAWLPLKPLELLILVVLSDGPRHGYGMVQAIAEETAGAVRLIPGNLYRVLKRLMDRGLLAPASRRAVPELDDQRRRYYRLTALGRRTAAIEVGRLESLVAAARRRRLIDRPETSDV